MWADSELRGTGIALGSLRRRARLLIEDFKLIFTNLHVKRRSSLREQAVDSSAFRAKRTAVFHHLRTFNARVKNFYERAFGYWFHRDHVIPPFAHHGGEPVMLCNSCCIIASSAAASLALPLCLIRPLVSKASLRRSAAPAGGLFRFRLRLTITIR